MALLFSSAEELHIDFKASGKHQQQLAQFAKETRDGMVLPEEAQHVRSQNDAEEQKADHPGDANPARQRRDPNHHGDDNGEFGEVGEGDNVISDRVE